jgi:hypothetical protein
MADAMPKMQSVTVRQLAEAARSATSTCLWPENSSPSCSSYCFYVTNRSDSTG